MSDFDARHKRTKRPCPLWVDAFQRDTQHLEADEVGAYLLILMAMWTRLTCDFPDDDTRLARVARVSPRLWKFRIGPVLRAFFAVENGALVSKRLRKEAAFVERQSTAQRDRKTGENADKSLKNNKADPTTDDAGDSATDDTGEQPTYYLQPTKKEGGGGSAHAREADPTDRELILAAIGVDPVSGLTGHGGRQIGTTADMAEARLWLGLPGLTIPVICAEIRAQMGRKRDGPPSSFRYFTQSMCRLSGALSQAPLTPEPPIPNGEIRHDRQAFDRAIHSLADRLSDGTVALDHASRDPWAAG